MRDRTLLWTLVGAGVAGALYAFRKQAASAVGVVMDEVQQGIFKAVIPSVARPYADVILQVAREQSISPFLITQLGYRETLWGNSRALDHPGPSGRGDHGHGHGLMQIDDRSWGNWLANNDWTDPYLNVSFAVGTVLKQKMAFFSSRSGVAGLTDGTTVTLGPKAAAARKVAAGGYPDPRPLYGDALMQAAVAAYNSGEGSVLMSLAAGVDPDTTTEGGNYSEDVLARTASLIDLFNSNAAAV